MKKNLMMITMTALVCAIVYLTVAPIVSHAAEEEIVVFNTKSLKYHCATCERALKCTRELHQDSQERGPKAGRDPVQGLWWILSLGACPSWGGTEESSTVGSKAEVPMRS